MAYQYLFFLVQGLFCFALNVRPCDYNTFIKIYSKSIKHQCHSPLPNFCLLGMVPTKIHPRLDSSAAILRWNQYTALPIKFSSNSTVTSRQVAFLCSVIMVGIISVFLLHLYHLNCPEKLNVIYIYLMVENILKLDTLVFSVTYAFQTHLLANHDPL